MLARRQFAMMRAMPPPASISAFPWDSLERVPRSAVRTWGVLNRNLAARVGELSTPLAEALGSWIGAPVRFEWCSLRSDPIEPGAEAARFELRVDPGPIQVSLQLDARLVTRLVSFALERPGELYDPRPRLDEALLGAAAAITVKLIEDARLGIGVQFICEPLDIPNAQRVQLDALVHIGGVAYRLWIGVAMSPLQPTPTPRTDALASLGRLPLALPTVIGTSLVRRDDLAKLAPGTGFLPGSGLWVDECGHGRAVLIAPSSDCGIGIELAPGGKIVLREVNVTLNPDEPTSTVATPSASASAAGAVSDAPVVVRVELAAVSLPAQQWAQLRAGDILETGKPLGTEVTLRVAGQALAKGELLNIDGELGVRITKLLTEEP